MTATPGQVEVCTAMLKESLLAVPVKRASGGVFPCAWNIPSAAGRRTGTRCFVSGQPIQGPEFWLNQLTPGAQPAAIALSTAVMWHRCCTFSPIGDGQIFNPV
jgi:hypothetical protein